MMYCCSFGELVEVWGEYADSAVLLDSAIAIEHRSQTAFVEVTMEIKSCYAIGKTNRLKFKHVTTYCTKVVAKI